jgi:serine/threonine protein phosphatase PrpC
MPPKHGDVYSPPAESAEIKQEYTLRQGDKTDRQQYRPAKVTIGDKQFSFSQDEQGRRTVIEFELTGGVSTEVARHHLEDLGVSDLHGGTLSIGRNPAQCQLVSASGFVSRKHATLEFFPDGTFTIESIGSQLPTEVELYQRFPTNFENFAANEETVEKVWQHSGEVNWVEGRGDEVLPVVELNNAFMGAATNTNEGGGEYKRNYDAIHMGKTNNDEIGVLSLGDGLADHEQSAEFAEATTRMITEGILQMFNENEGVSFTDSSIEEYLKDVLIYSKNECGITLEGKSGAANITAVVMGRKVFLAWVGDSRGDAISDRSIEQAIHAPSEREEGLDGSNGSVMSSIRGAWRGLASHTKKAVTRVQRLTPDDNFVDKLLLEGTITEEEAAAHPYRTVITKHLGDKGLERKHIHTKVIELEPGDVLHLHSDGANKLPHEQLISIVEGHGSQEAPKRIVEEAAKRTHDNVTSAVVYIT